MAEESCMTHEFFNVAVTSDSEVAGPSSKTFEKMQSKSV